MNGGRSEHVAVLNKTFPYAGAGAGAGAFYNNDIGGHLWFYRIRSKIS